MTLTAVPDSATSLIALAAVTALRRESTKIVRMVTTAKTASIRMPQPPSHATMSAMTPPTAPAAGSVSSQPTMIRPAVRQRTVEPRRPRPDPITDPEATWVVDSAKPSALEARIVAAVELSAEKPCAGLTSVSPLPRVRMMRQPPM